MSNSTTQLDQISTNQSSKEVVVNALLDAASPGMIWGRHASACSGLTWGYYGGQYAGNAIANGTLTLTASTTNYVYGNASTGAVSVNTSGVPAGAIPLYSIVTGATTVTSYSDLRSYAPMSQAGAAFGNQTANYVFAGPTSGAAAAPAFRALVAADLPVMVASGASHAAGAVPDPGATAGTTHYLREDGTWQVPPGSGGSSTLAGLSDVNVTEGAGINGYSLTWSNATSKWVATNITGGGGASALSGLSDVNVTEGSAIDQYALVWDNTSAKWIAKSLGVGTQAFDGARAISDQYSILNPFLGGALSASSAGTNIGSARIMPIFVHRPMTVQANIFNVTAGSSDNRIQVAIYSADPTTGKPLTLLHCFSELTGATTGLQTSTDTYTFSVPGVYWIWVVGGGTTAGTQRALFPGSGNFYGMPGLLGFPSSVLTSSGTSSGGYNYTYSYVANTPPSSLTIGSLNEDFAGYRVFFKITAQGVSGGGGSGATNWVEKTANYTAVSGDAISANTSGGSFTVKLPASPTMGQAVQVCDELGTWGANPISIDPNGSSIQGLAQVETFYKASAKLVFTYQGATNGWMMDGAELVPVFDENNVVNQMYPGIFTYAAGRGFRGAYTTVGWSCGKASKSRSSGKLYFEFKYGLVNSNNSPLVGLAVASTSLAAYPGLAASDFGVLPNSSGTSTLWQNGGSIASGSAGTSFGAGDVLGCSVDFTNGVITIYKNNTQIIQKTGLTLSNPLFLASAANQNSGACYGIFSTRATHCTYSPPSGFSCWDN